MKGKSFNILAKGKQQLIECEICDCQIEGGNSNLRIHNQTSMHINIMNKKERGTTIDDI